MSRDISAWLERKLGPSLPSEAEMRVCCPFCDDSKYHLYYNPAKNVFHCFKCEASGSGLDLIMKVDGISALDAARLLAPNRIVPPPKKAIAEMPAWYVPLFPVPTEPKPGWHTIYSYAKSRKFTDEDILRYGLGYAPSSWLLRGRLIIPIERGYYQARDTIGLMPKYLNPDVPKGNRLFNYRVLGSPYLAVCEGAISAIAASRVDGDPPAVAVLGKSVLLEQTARILAAGTKVVDIAFDAGTEDSDKTLQFAEDLFLHDVEVYIRAYRFGDPDECSEYARYKYTFGHGMRAKLLRRK